MKNLSFKSAIYQILSIAILSISSCVEEGDIDSIVSISSTQSSSQLASLSNGHEYVDLGLSVNWATCNVGAYKPEDYGDYYAWGETGTKSSYTWENYRFRTSGDSYENVKFNKYNIQNDRGIVDNRTTLELSDDVARQKWGGSWRMPTEKEFQELIDNCTWIWTTMNGVNGYRVTGKKSGYADRSIFLPAAGYRGLKLVETGNIGAYWYNTLFTGSTDRSRFAQELYFKSSSYSWTYIDRLYGQSVRPVFSSTQSGVTVSESECRYDCNGGTRIIQIYTENSWTVSTSADWITVSPKNGTGDKSLTITVTGNSSTTERSGYVTITPNGSNPVNISVSQDPSETSSTTTGTSNGHEYVDLGLSVKWSTCNIGASSPSAYGDYYAWGETSTKSDYSWSTYKYCNGSYTTMTKYCSDSDYGNNGYTDSRTTLELSDDVVRQKWGGSWRMPTYDEFRELIDNCTWTWTTMNGVNGYKVTSKRSGYLSRSIFLPAAGFRSGTHLYYAGEYGFYWSSSLYTDGPYYARYLLFDSGDHYTGNLYRYYGRSVRPVISSTQSGVTVSESECHYDCNGGTRIIQIYTENSWTVSASADWITVSPKNGTGDKSLTITVTGNSSTTERSGYVTITPNGSNPVNISVSQDPSETSSTTTGTSNGHEYVDLGLSVKWSTCNIGASSPSAYGDYYAWGETSTKSSYSWSTYKYCNGSSTTMTKYCNGSEYGNNGYTDSRTTLELSDDVARQKWGGSWRMPTEKEFQELIDNCTWTWTTMNGVSGYRVTSKKSGYLSRSIFLPAAGCRSGASLYDAGEYGYYWSSSLGTDYPDYARHLYFNSGNHGTSDDGRSLGLSVRPVCP